MEVEGKIPFLDILITRSEEGFQTEVYRKPCNTNFAVPPSSFSDPAYRRAAVVADVTRAVRYCSTPQARRKEIAFIYNKFRAHGYPTAFIRQAVDATVSRTEKRLAVSRGELPEEQPEATGPKPIRLSVPFIGQPYFALRRAAAKVGLQLVSRSLATLGGRLCSSFKHRLPKLQRPNSVYSIRCSCGQRYVGETLRELSTRIDEHRRGWTGQKATSAFATHHQCQPDFDGTEILASEAHPRLRLLLESSYIRTIGQVETIIASPQDISANRNAGAELDDRWLPVIQAAERREDVHRRLFQ
jgi:hypothetical protein